MAHLGSVVGRITDNTTQQPIAGAHITIADHHQGTVTDEAGYFRFNNLVPSTYRIEVSFVGYKAESKLVIVQSDITVYVNFALSEAPLQLGEVKVSAINPQHQQVISSLDMKTRTINNSQEVLRIIPGLVIGQHAGGGKAEQIFLRGFDIDHGTDIRLTVDGLPINMVSHAHGQGYADAHFIIPEFIERVDFNKGLYDAEKGNFATAGWADFQTKAVLDQSFVKTEVGQFNTYRLVAGANLMKTSTSNAYLGGEYNYSDSYFEAPQNFNRMNLFSKYHSHISQNTTLTLTASTFWSRWNASGQIPNRAVADGTIGYFGAIDPNEGGQTTRTNFNAVTETLTKRNQLWKNQFYYSNYGFELYSNFTFFLVDPVNKDQIRQRENRNLWGYASRYSLTHSVNARQATFKAGLDYRQDLTRGSELSRTRDRSVLLQALRLGDVNEANVGLYVDETLQISRRLSATAGVRMDFFRNRYTDRLANGGVSKAAASILSPKLNLFYTHDSSLQFYLNAGKGFHSNDTRVVVERRGLRVLPAAYGLDAGTVWKPLPRLLVNAAYWYLWLDQEFIYVGDAGVVEPSGRSLRKGVDLSLRYQLGKRLFADVDANWADPRAVGLVEGQNYIPLAVGFTSSGGLAWKAEKGFTGSWRYRHIADRPANEDYSIVAEGYFVSDLQLGYSWRNYAVGVSVQNLFGTYWKETQFATESQLQNEASPVEEIHFTPGTPFNARMCFTWRFQ